jgi:hypothetical protein
MLKEIPGIRNISPAQDSVIRILAGYKHIRINKEITEIFFLNFESKQTNS